MLDINPVTLHNWIRKAEATNAQAMAESEQEKDAEVAQGQVRGSGVSVLSESRDSVIGGVRVRLGVDVGSLGCFFGGLRVAVIEGVGGYEVSGLFQARQRHVALLLDPIIMLLG